jgi:hypothetical protein
MTRFTAPSIWLPGFDPEPLELLAPTIGSAFETDDVELADDSRVALGRILEPSACIGHFIGAMPRHMAQRSSVTAIEIDRLSGRMLKALYAPAGEELRLSPFEKTSLAGNWFDLAIGNVPFGRYQVADTCNRAYARFSIHNYFFGRALDLVRPGGLVCFITSSHTMEAQAESVRAYIAAQAQMLGAIRLPKGTFACLASTGVQTDILFLRKRRRAEPAEADWLQIGIVPDSLRHPHCHERYLPINGWYVKHPEFCIGSIRRESNGYEEVPAAVFEGDRGAGEEDSAARARLGTPRAADDANHQPGNHGPAHCRTRCCRRRPALAGEGCKGRSAQRQLVDRTDRRPLWGLRAGAAYGARRDGAQTASFKSVRVQRGVVSNRAGVGRGNSGGTGVGAEHHADASAQLALRRKRLDDLRLELARPFEHENRLAESLARQRQLLKCLDLDKDEAGSGKGRRRRRAIGGLTG